MRMFSASDEERLAMGLCGRRKVEEEFDERIVIGRYLSVLADIARVRVVRGRTVSASVIGR